MVRERALNVRGKGRLCIQSFSSSCLVRILAVARGAILLLVQRIITGNTFSYFNQYYFQFRCCFFLFYRSIPSNITVTLWPRIITLTPLYYGNYMCVVYILMYTSQNVKQT